MREGKLVAAVGSDGMRLVVWGMGPDEDTARRDAEHWLSDCWESKDEPLTFHEVTAEQAAEIERGNVAWPVVVAVATLTREAFEAHLSEIGETGAARLRGRELYTRREENADWLRCGLVADAAEAQCWIDEFYA